MSGARLPWLLGTVGLLGAMLGWWLDPLRFHAAWTANLAAWLEWPLGSLALLLVHALTGGRWGYAIRPALLTGIATLPLLLPAALPLLLHMHTLYPWVQPTHDLPNAFYLNRPFFYGRGVIYLLVWFGIGGLALWWLRRRDLPPAGFAGPALILLAATATFAAIDVTLSLKPDFNSSVWGMIAAAGSGLMALAIAAMLSAAAVPREVLADLGKLLLGLVVLWAYLDFVQFLIVWESDLPGESAWYLARVSDGWRLAILLIGVGHFLLPFAALIVPAVQRSRRAIMAIGAWLVVMEVLRVWWLVLPAVPYGFSWIAFACLLGFAGLAAGLAGRAPRLDVAHV
jgi:hypothetical protein